MNDETALTSETKAHLSDILNDKAQMTSCQADLKKVNADFNAYKKTSRFHWLRDVGIALGIGFGFGEHFAK